MKNITFFIASMEAGGAERITMYMVNELVKRDWQVSLLLCRASGSNLKFIDPAVKIIELKYRRTFFNIIPLVKYLTNAKPTNFYSVMNYVNVVTMMAVWLSKYKGNVILSEHTSVVLNNRASKVVYKAAQKLYPLATKIICISEGVKQTLNRTVSHLDNIEIIPNPVILSDIKKHDQIHNTFRFMAMGRLEPEKNYHLLLKAFDKLSQYDSDKRIELYIYGEGRLKTNLVLEAKKMGLADRVFFPGYIDDVFQKMSESDCFVLSSDNEGLPTVLVEALSSGLPVISTNCPSGPSEILQNGKFGRLVPVNDIEGLYVAMKQELLGKSMSNINERIKRAQEFSVENVMDRYEQLLKRN